MLDNMYDSLNPVEHIVASPWRFYHQQHLSRATRALTTLQGGFCYPAIHNSELFEKGHLILNFTLLVLLVKVLVVFCVFTKIHMHLPFHSFLHFKNSKKLEVYA
jgi:hypothetical protein